MPKPSPKTSEKLTRKQLIDQRLVNAGWRIVPERQFDASKPPSAYDRCAFEEYATESGPADCALCAEGKIVGIVEAKKLTLGPQNVLSQAERYSKGVKSSPLNFRGFRVPFLYSTNGEVIWYHDIRHDCVRFPTMWSRISRSFWRMHWKESRFVNMKAVSSCPARAAKE